jgi:hypothetical protein
VVVEPVVGNEEYVERKGVVLLHDGDSGGVVVVVAVLGNEGGKNPCTRFHNTRTIRQDRNIEYCVMMMIGV